MLERIKPLAQLVNEMLDHLPAETWTSPTTTFLDPAIGGGQFVREIERRLRAAGHSDENIRGRVFGFEYTTALIDIAINMHKLVGQYKPMSYDEFFAWETDMKFDVVVGNPPYQSTHGVNSHALWESILGTAHNLTSDGGYVVMITPHIGRRKIRRVFFENDFLLYRSQNVADHFPGVGSTFCYHVVRKTQTGIMPNIDGVPVDVSRFGFVPGRMDQETLQTLNELTQGDSLNIQGGGTHSSKKHLFSDTQCSDFPYKYQHTSSQIRYCSVQCPAMDHKLKVVCSKSGYLKPWLDQNQIGITEGSWCIPVNSAAEAQRIIDFLNSDKVNVFNEISGSNTGAHDPNKYKLLRMKK